MRILHVSDIHIGIETYGRPAAEVDIERLPPTFAPGEDRKPYLGYSTRLLDFLCAFDEVVAYAIQHKVDLLLFTGDAYKNREPTQTHQREFAKRIARLAASGIPVVLLVGNHDLPHASYKANSIEIFDTLNVPNVTVTDRLDVYRVKTRAGPLQVLAIPWIRRSAFLARDDVRNLPFEQINKLLEQKLTNAIQAAADELDRSTPAIVAAHVTVGTAKLGTERSMMIGYDHVLMQSTLTALPADYVGLGHIHHRQELSQRPPMLYPGSLQRIDFGEEDHEAKGFYIVELDAARPLGERVAKLDFHPVQARAFVTIDVTLLENDLDPTLTVVQAIERHHIADAIVRLHIKLPASLAAMLREREIRQAVERHGAHAIAAITRDVERTSRPRLGALSLEQQTPLQLLGHYLSSKQVGKERSERLMTLAKGLMDSEDRDNA
ncbi:MAG: exonuclease SbcCD subunit D [Chloroflexi bacterium]|nr:exonuclease SbcCD subunit D [Chloroflexota bacterium]